MLCLLSPNLTLLIYLAAAGAFLALYLHPSPLIHFTLKYFRLNARLFGLDADVRTTDKTVRVFRTWLAFLLIYTLALSAFVSVCIRLLH
jgi:hypothetical protein